MKSLEGHLGKSNMNYSINDTMYIIENMEIYLVAVNDTVEFAEKLDKIKEDCNLDFDGSLMHKYIHLLVIDLFKS